MTFNLKKAFFQTTEMRWIILQNSGLKRLGLTIQDCVVIIHSDIIGMCQTSVKSLGDLFVCGGVTSGASMVPCAWFPAGVALLTRFPQSDLGVHLAVISEWRSYRWGTISTRDQQSCTYAEKVIVF